MAKKLFRQHCIELSKLRELLHKRQKKDGTQIIISDTNQKIVDEAKRHVEIAYNILQEVE